jgi:NarL family two-component system response regulator YdfI
MSARILIADDDQTICSLFSLDCETRGNDATVSTVASGDEAIVAIERLKPQVLVLDLRMSKGDGFHVLEHLKETGSTIPVVVVTNYKNDAYEQRCKEYGVKKYMIKHEHPMSRIVDTVTACLES